MISNNACMYKDQSTSEWGNVHFNNLNTIASTNLKIRSQNAFLQSVLEID